MFKLPVGKVTSVMSKIITTPDTSVVFTIKNVFNDVILTMSQLQQIAVMSQPAKITIDVIGINPNDGEYMTLENQTLENSDFRNYISHIYYPYKAERGNVSYLVVNFEMLEITDEITDSNFDNNRMESVCLD